MSPAKKVALTFDDGPNPPYTHQILDILAKKKIKATFFVCGANIERYSEIVKRIAKEGHLIGNHTFFHQRIPTLLGLNYQEIIKSQELITKLTSQTEKLFRPPWGYMPFWLRNKLVRDGFKIIPYDDSSHDWEDNISSEQITNNVINHSKDKQIILLHDGHDIKKNVNRSKTVEALPQIIDKLKKLGFKFVSSLDSIS